MVIESFDDLRQALKPYIENRSAQPYTLDRMRQLMAYLDNPQNSYRVIHIAGTSGKTSTAYYAAALLKGAGFRTGLTVSPHTLEVNDRVQIDCQPLLEPLFCADFELFMEEVQASGIWPTYFELMSGFAFWEFARQGVDYAVVEVGLGGLLDATNVIDRTDTTCIITDIGLDHTAILGNTHGAIATQKAGIIHEGSTVCMYRQSDEVMTAVQARVDQTQATLKVITPADVDAPEVLPLFQQRNFGLARYAIEQGVLSDGQGLSPSIIQQASRTFIPGRMEIFSIQGKTVILDSAHNGQKIQALMDSIGEQYTDHSIAMLLGFLDGPAVEERIPEILDICVPYAEYTAVVEFGGPQDEPYRSIAMQEVTRIIDSLDTQHKIVRLFDTKAAFDGILKRPEDVIVVTGSIYLLNHIRPLAVAYAKNSVKK